MHGRHADRSSGFAVRPRTMAPGSCFWSIAIVAALAVVLRIDYDLGPDPGSRASSGSRPLAAIRSGDGPILSLSWSPDGKTLATAGFGTSIRAWDADSGCIRSLDEGKTDGEKGRPMLPARVVAFSPAGRILAVGRSDGSVTLRDFDTGVQFARLAGDRCIRTLAWSPDGRTLAVAADDGEIRLWDFEGDRVRVLARSARSCSNLAWSPDGRTIASPVEDGMVRLWDVPTGADRLALKAHACGISEVAFSGDGGTVIVARFAGPMRAWDASTGRERVAPVTSTRGAAAVAISPDGRRFASALREGLITVWDIATGVEVKRLSGHTNAVSMLAWSADGRFLASASYDATARVWDLSRDPFTELSACRPRTDR